MSLLQYLQRTDSLLDPRGSLSSTVQRQSIAHANQEVQAAVDLDVEVKERGKHGPYNCYSLGDCAAIGRYASQHGVAAAARFFS